MGRIEWGNKLWREEIRRTGEKKERATEEMMVRIEQGDRPCRGQTLGRIQRAKSGEDVEGRAGR